MIKTSICLLILLVSCNQPQAQLQKKIKDDAIPLPVELPIIMGASDTESYFPELKGKRIGCIVNQTAVADDIHLIDRLVKNDFNVVKIFSPEHGFRGMADAGETVVDGKDEKTGIEIISLYGPNKKFPSELLEGIDILVFDIQDVGVRFYTYISTMHYAMAAAGKKGIPFVVLDRPNPNGHYVDGPILEKEHTSFVGIHPIPIVHGLTVGELAKMISGEKWIEKSPKLKVVPIQHYNHQREYILPIAPSPNLPNQHSIYLYPSLCLLEPTEVSVGRGTNKQFQLYGHPNFESNFTFTPQPNAGAKHPKLEGKRCNGIDLSTKSLAELRQNKLNLKYLWHSYSIMKGEDFFRNNMFYKISGTKKIKEALQKNISIGELRSEWNEELKNYESIRSKYLLYD